MTTHRLRAGFFAGPWQTPHRAQDGAIFGFRDVESAILRETQAPADSGIDPVPLDITLFQEANAHRRLQDLDVIYANCGPLAALLMDLRERHELPFRLIREVRTLGWIGYAFQELVAAWLQRPGDICVHTSAYSVALWSDIREADDVFYYPLLHQAPVPAPEEKPGPLRCFYSSRVAKDKGFQHLDRIIARLRTAGWPIAALDVCGHIEDPRLMHSVVQQLTGQGVAVSYHGALPRPATLDRMAKADLLLFPSLSSFEASGRCVVEAFGLGKTVIASDYCIGHDLLTKPYRIPLAGETAAQGRSSLPFAVAQLDIDAWVPPQAYDPNFKLANCQRYLASSTSVTALLSSTSTLPRASSRRSPSLAFRVHWAQTDAAEVHELVLAVRQGVLEGNHRRQALLDLGGVLKQLLLRNGFDPEVGFARRAGDHAAEQLPRISRQLRDGGLTPSLPWGRSYSANGA